MKMTIEKKLQIETKLTCNIPASSYLLKELEVIGFVNSSNNCNYGMNGMVDKDSSRQVVCSDFIYQIITITNQNTLIEHGRTTPIFKTIQKCDSEKELNIKELYIPSLMGNKTYGKIKARISSKYNTISERDIKDLNDSLTPFELFNGKKGRFVVVGQRR